MPVFAVLLLCIAYSNAQSQFSTVEVFTFGGPIAPTQSQLDEFATQIQSLIATSIGVAPVWTAATTDGATVSVAIQFVSGTSRAETAMASWPPSPVAIDVSSAAQNIFGVSLTSATPSSTCTFQNSAMIASWTTGAPASTVYTNISGCQTTLSLRVSTRNTVSAVQWRTSICNVIGGSDCTSCSSTNCAGITAGAAVADATNGGFTSSISIDGVNPQRVATVLLSAIQSENVFFRTIDLLYIAINDVVAFTTVESPPQPAEKCNNANLFYLVFLIALVPLLLMAVRYAYRRGKVRGREKYQAEINAHGVSMQIQQLMQQQQQQQFLNSSTNGNPGGAHVMRMQTPASGAGVMPQQQFKHQRTMSNTSLGASNAPPQQPLVPTNAL